MSRNVNLFYPFRSPYSYPAVPGALHLERAFDVSVALLPVLPLALPQPDYFNSENVKRAKYIMMHWLRRTETRGKRHRWPSPDPIVQDSKTCTIAPDQPYIYRLTCLGVKAQRRGSGFEFAFEESAVNSGITSSRGRGESRCTRYYRALRCADIRVQGGTVLRPGPNCYAALATGQSGTETLMPSLPPAWSAPRSSKVEPSAGVAPRTSSAASVRVKRTERI